MRMGSLWSSLILLLGSAGAIAQDAAAEVSAQFLREACWAESLGAMMVALDVREVGSKEARRIHVDKNPNERAASAAAEALASLEKSPVVDPVSFTVGRHLACLAQRVPGITYSNAALGECFAHSALLERIGALRDGKVPLDDVLARERATPDRPAAYRGTQADWQSMVREMYRQNPSRINRYVYGQFMACLVDQRGTEGDPQAETIAQGVWQQQCWSTGQLAFDIGNDWVRSKDATALSARYNRDGAQAEAADMIVELGKTPFKNGADYAANRYASCMKAAPVEVRSQTGIAVASCYARIFPHRIVATWRESGRSKDEARKALVAALGKGDAGAATADTIVDWVYTGSAALSEYRLFALFRACAAQSSE